MRRRPASAAMLAGLVLAALAAPAAAAGDPATGGGVPPVEDGVVQDDLLQIAVNRVYAQAPQFYGGDYRSISVVRISDGHLAAANGDQWHVSLSAAKAVWVALAMEEFGADAVRPYVSRIFVNSSNTDASRVLGLWVVKPKAYGNHAGADAVNAAMWGWGFQDSYLYGWFSPGGGNYGYHLSSTQLPGFPDHCCVRVWATSNFTSTSDLARFWAMAAGGEILDEAATDQFLEWARLARYEGSGLISPRLPDGVAAGVAHKAGWNAARTRRIDGGVVTTPTGEQYAIAISFRLHESQTAAWNGAAREWARYASCEIYDEIAGTDRDCTRSGDPAAIRNHTTAPIGGISGMRAETGQVVVKGWALDPDAGADAVDVRLTVDGTAAATVTADALKTSVHRRHGLGNYHGFRAILPVEPGEHRVCGVAVNDSGRGPDTPIGCKTVTVPGAWSPEGGLSGARITDDRVSATGWATDADAPGPVTVRIAVDGAVVGRVVADRGVRGNRFVAGPYPGFGPGRHVVCATAMNGGPPADSTLLGCRSVSTTTSSPEGRLTKAVFRADGRLIVRGWAADPDTPAPVAIRVTIDGDPAPGPMRDAGGDGTVFRKVIAAGTAPGTHEVCVVALDDTGDDPDTPIGCLTALAPAP